MKHRNENTKSTRPFVPLVIAALGLSLLQGSEAPVPKQNQVVESVGQSPEKASQRHREATMQIRLETIYKNKGGGDEGSLANTAQNCTATHIGGGWFVTASHCVEGTFNVEGTPARRDAIFDLEASDLPLQFTMWSGKDLDVMKQVGIADHVIVNGNPGPADFALLHVPGTESMPAVEVGDRAIPNASNFDIVGYPAARSDQVQSPLSYLATTTAGDITAGHGLSDEVPMLIFTTDKDADKICHPGMSGSTVVDDTSTALGVLSRYDKREIGSSMWYAFKDRLPNPDDILCGFNPIDTGIVETYKQAAGLPAPEGAAIITQ
jgi:hypothetical protein